MPDRTWTTLLLLATTQAPAAGPSAEVLKLFLQPGRAAWTLVLRDRDASDLWPQDETFQRLMEDQDVAIARLTPMAARAVWDLWARPGVARALLVSRKDFRILELPGLPSGEALLAALASADYQTVRERREAYLREHPDQGELLDASLASALGVARSRIRNTRDGSPMTAEEADKLFKDTADTLDQLLKLPDWWRLPHLPLLCRTLEEGQAGLSPRMRGLLAGMREDVRQQWSRSPRFGSGTLGALWISLERSLEQGEPGYLPAFLPAPGEIWPRRFEVNALARRLWEGREWKTLLAFLEDLPSQIPGPASGPADWREFVERQAHVHLLKTVALGKQWLWEDAELAAQDCRRWAGKGWREAAAALLEVLGNDRLPPPDPFLTVLKMDPLMDWPVPVPPGPVHMVRKGPDQAGPKDDPAFLPWGPDELTWGAASAREEELLAAWAGGQKPPRWAAFQGPGTLLAAWEEGTRPQAMAQTLATIATPRLEWLAPFLARDPGHLDARRKRFQILRNRMPCPGLEPLLAEDATAVRLAVTWGEGGWKPDRLIWEAPLAQAMPALEGALRRWPGSADLWRVWISWARLHPDQPSAHAFAQSMPVPQPRSRWLCRLPEEVHQAIARELRDSGRLAEARDWFREAWEGLKLAVEDPEPGLGDAMVETIYCLLREILAASGGAFDRPSLDKERQNLLARLQEGAGTAAPKAKPGPFEAFTGLPVPSPMGQPAKRPSPFVLQNR